MGRLDAADGVIVVLLGLISLLPAVLAVWIVVSLLRIERAIAALSARFDALEQRRRNE